MDYVVIGIFVLLFLMMIFGNTVALWWNTLRLTPPDREVLALGRYATTELTCNTYSDYLTLTIDEGKTKIVIHKDNLVSIYQRRITRYDEQYDLISNYTCASAVRIQLYRLYCKRQRRIYKEAERVADAKKAAELKAARSKAIPIVNKIVQDAMHKTPMDGQ